jgi:hypothetical protein
VIDSEKVLPEIDIRIVESVELGERVFSDGDQHVDGDLAIRDEVGQCVDEGESAGPRLVVHEILVELVEDEEHAASDASCPLGHDLP